MSLTGLRSISHWYRKSVEEFDPDTQKYHELLPRAREGEFSLEGYLTHHQLQHEGIDLEGAVREFCQDCLPLKHPPLALQQLYRKLAEKNIDPVWSQPLKEKYADNLHDLVSRVSRQEYKTLESILEAIDALKSPVVL